ncbi:MAG: 50S ribosomal protein L21 [Planctomycetes bacterium]|nr:50S ribosomal protein L21 [Planctomycetota bacterium]
MIEDSGRQLRVAEGDVVDVDLRDLADDAREIEFDRVLLVSEPGSVKVGTPLVRGAKVIAEILEPLAKGPKLHVYRFRRRKDSRRKIGHRQKYIRVRIARIES